MSTNLDKVRPKTFSKRAFRAALCAENGVRNTGRQWRKLRKRLAAQARGGR